MNAEELYMIMLGNDVRGQHIARKIGVSQPTVYRWYTGVVSIPVIAAKTIDYVYGNGVSGSALDHAQHLVRDKWVKYIDNLNNLDLVDIASGGANVGLSNWEFCLMPITYDGQYDNERYINVYEGDTCGMSLVVNDNISILLSNIGLEHPLGSALYEDDEDLKEMQDALIVIAGQAQRDEMRRQDTISFIMNNISIYNEEERLEKEAIEKNRI